MRCALVSEVTSLVENVIVADPATDPAPEGFTIVGLADDSPVSMGWRYHADGTFTAPPIEEEPAA